MSAALVQASRPSAPTKLSDRVTACVRADIVACRLQPGTKLKIAELCEKHGVSLGAVREALSRLSAEGIVVAEPQRGFKVAPVSLEELADLTATRIDIERLCLLRSIEHGDLAWEGRVVAARHELLQTPDRDPSLAADQLPEDWSRAHRAFHLALVSACGSPTLLGIRTQLYDRSERYRRLSVPLDRGNRDVTREHEQLADAVLSRNGDRTARLIGEHLSRTTGIIEASAEALGLAHAG